MLRSLFFVSLLASAFATFINIKSSEYPNFNQNYNSFYSNSENQHDKTDGKSSYQVLAESDRDYLVRKFLFDYKTYASSRLIEIIVGLTDGYTNTQITDLLIDMLSVSKKKEEEGRLEYVTCLEKLKEAIKKIDRGQIKKRKLIQVAELIFLFGPFFKIEWSLKGGGAVTKKCGFETVFPTEKERLEIVKETLRTYKKSASEFEMQMIVEETSGHDIDSCKNWVTTRIKASKSGSLDQDRLLNCPLSHERREVVEEILLLAKKSAPKSLIQDIADLTSWYDMHTITKLVNRMVKKSKTDSLNRDSCIEILKKEANSIEENELKKFKLDQIEAVIAGDNLF